MLSVDVHKYAGTFKDCEVCANEFLNHPAYHLIYHYMCTFCSAERKRFFDIRDEEEYWDNFLEMRDLESRSCQ